MSWVDDVLNSDAARANPEAARRIVEGAGGVVPKDFEESVRRVKGPAPSPEAENE